MNEVRIRKARSYAHGRKSAALEKGLPKPGARRSGNYKALLGTSQRTLWIVRTEPDMQTAERLLRRGK
jgi:hypothetical protein